MKIAIVYKSLTGNTKMVADAVKNALKQDEVVYVGAPTDAMDAEIYFVGSWTDKGNCDATVGAFLQKLEGKQIAYFATAGFGGSQEYYDTLASRVEVQIPESNTLLGSFICQGKMPLSVRDRYVAMLQANPEDKNLEVNIKNFDEALTHPDEADLRNVEAWAHEMLDKAKK